VGRRKVLSLEVGDVLLKVVDKGFVVLIDLLAGEHVVVHALDLLDGIHELLGLVVDARHELALPVDEVLDVGQALLLTRGELALQPLGTLGFVFIAVLRLLLAADHPEKVLRFLHRGLLALLEVKL